MNDTPKPTASPAEPMQSPEATIEPTEKPQALEVSNDGEIKISVNGKAVSFPDAKPFIDENDRTQAPVRAVSEMLNADVDWDEETQTVTVSQDGKIIKIIIGSDAKLRG